MRQPAYRHGFTMLDVLALVTTVAVAISVIVPLLDRGKAVRDEIRIDRQLASIHQAFLIFAKDTDGVLPRPGLIRRKPVELRGELRYIPGRGEEDWSVNTTAQLYSSLIMQNYFLPRLVVDTNDPNPHVKVKEDFNYERYNPIRAVYWDDEFKADLENVSHASFAHLLLYGDRAIRYWRDTHPETIPVLSTRGPRDGKNDPESLTTDDEGNWSGYIVPHTDGKAHIDTMTPDWLRPAKPARVDHEGNELAPIPDNIFEMQTGPRGRDVVLTFTQAIGDDGPVIQHD